MAAVFRYARAQQRLPKTLQRVRLEGVTVPTATSEVFNLTSVFGNYARASQRGGLVRFAYSHLPTPDFEFERSVSTSGGCSEPRFCFTPRQTIVMLYACAGNLYERQSTDDGKTWTGEALLVAAAKHPDIAADSSGLILRAWYAGGLLTATRQYPGEAAAGASFTLKDGGAVNLAVQDDSFRLAPDVRGWWWLHVRIAAAGATSLWFSTDDGATFAPTSGAVSGITGGSHPGLAAGHDGTLWAWATVGGVLRLTRRTSGEADWSSPATVLDQAAANLTVKDIPSSMALAWERPQRLILATIYSTHVGPSDWWSADCGGSFKRFLGT